MSEPLRLLLIEDDLVDRQSVRRMLKRGSLKAQVREAESLGDALRALGEEHFDCVLLDLNLPDGDGLELLRRFQEAERSELAPVVVLTGHREEDLIHACLQAGAQDYLIKGRFQGDALERAIRYAQERHRLAQTLAEQASDLKRSNVELERFAYAASHDLQEPLRTLSAMGERLDARYADALGPEGGELLERMLGATERMRLLIKDLLDLSRISTLKADPERVELRGLIEEVEADLAAGLSAAGQGASIEVEDEDELPAVRGVRSQLRRVLQNLIGNALKFRAEGRSPRVILATRVVPAGHRDSFAERAPMARVELSVTDNGIGFAPDQAEAIFQPFKRLHGRTRYPGTGIGLAICKAIVETHRGRVRAEPAPSGQGARFVLTLPAADAGPAPAAQPG